VTGAHAGATGHGQAPGAGRLDEAVAELVPLLTAFDRNAARRPAAAGAQALRGCLRVLHRPVVNLG
jgi:hypothetical protein